jgi:glycosyltransferase involved in cell wall biosynthesis
MPQQKTTVTIITPTLLCGGSENQVQLLCNNINTQQFLAQLIVINNSNAFYTISNNVPVINLNKPSALRAIVALLKLLRKQQPQIIYSTANHISLLLCIFKFLLPTTSKLICREGSMVSQNTKNAKYPILYKWLLKKYYKKANAIVCLYQGMATDLQKNFNCTATQLHLIAPAVVTPNIKPLQPNTHPVYITVARLALVKQIHKIIAAVQLLPQPFTYYIIGEGSELPALEALVQKNNLTQQVIFVGAIQQPFKNYTNAAAYLHYSAYEGLPNSVIEALSHGIPVVAFNDGGSIQQLIQHGVNGLLVQADDAQTFANNILQSGTINYNRQSIAAAVNKTYGVAQYIQQTQNLFTTMANNN